MKDICQNNIFPKFVFILSDTFKGFFCFDASIVAETAGM